MKRANSTMRVTYSGPTDLPLPCLGVIPLRTSARRDLLQISINRRFGSTSESGCLGTCLSPTPNCREKPSRSAKSQLSTARTGTRRAMRRAIGCPPRRFRTNSAGQEASWSRSRSISQFTCSPERLNSGIRASRFGAPGPVTTAWGSRSKRPIRRSATGTSVSPSTARLTKFTAGTTGRTVRRRAWVSCEDPGSRPN